MTDLWLTGRRKRMKSEMKMARGGKMEVEMVMEMQIKIKISMKIMTTLLSYSS